jgi:hydroxymethylbilane synthase
MLCSHKKWIIPAAARSSPLSKIQVQEILKELQIYHPEIDFEIHYVLTIGDRDRATSLRSLDRTDFFTREIDQLILNKQVRIGIHSAKDLPVPLPEGLAVVCLTQGLDPGDALVMREGLSIHTLPKGACIATSSVRREEAAKQLRPDLTFIDLRGTIAERLEKLEKGQADGVIVAEAALIRLGLTHLNRITLPGETVEGQGRLAVTALKDDREMQRVFACLHQEP